MLSALFEKIITDRNRMNLLQNVSGKSKKRMTASVPHLRRRNDERMISSANRKLIVNEQLSERKIKLPK